MRGRPHIEHAEVEAMRVLRVGEQLAVLGLVFVVRWRDPLIVKLRNSNPRGRVDIGRLGGARASGRESKR